MYVECFVVCICVCVCVIGVCLSVFMCVRVQNVSIGVCLSVCSCLCGFLFLKIYSCVILFKLSKVEAQRSFVIFKTFTRNVC